MRRTLLLLSVGLFLGLLIWVIWSLAATRPGTATRPRPTSSAPAAAPATAPEPPSTTGPVLASSTPTPAPAATPNPASDFRLRHAYVLQLDGNSLSLVARQDIEGDFAPPRHPAEEWSRMLRLRLVSADGVVLAEELQPAPDVVCTVLDAHSGGPARPTNYSSPGPVVFQVRMPRFPGAARLVVSRITQPNSPSADLPLGDLDLASP